MKKLLCILISLFTILTGLLPNFIVYAEDISSANSSDGSYTWNIPLDQDYYENTIYDENGEPVTLTVTSTPSITRVSNGTKQISYSSTNLNMSYVINISNNKITNAYDPQYSTAYTVLHSNLSFKSTEATMSLTIYQLFSQITHSLTASIKSSQLVTTFK